MSNDYKRHVRLTCPICKAVFIRGIWQDTKLYEEICDTEINRRHCSARLTEYLTHNHGRLPNPSKWAIWATVIARVGANGRAKYALKLRNANYKEMQFIPLSRRGELC